MTKTVQYVTALYNIYGQIDDILPSNFKHFLETKLDIILFTDMETLPVDLSGSTVRVVNLPQSELQSILDSEVSLPSYRNEKKDTLKFIQITNSKPEFLKRAMEMSDADAFVWFDFGILKVSKSKDQFLKRLSKAPECFSIIPNKIILPGCKSWNDINMNELHVRPLWRFCGGIILIPRTLVQTFFNLCLNEIKQCHSEGKLTWEANLWFVIEKKLPELFHWYAADCNDFIVNF
jgi:hypothetical protein